LAFECGDNVTGGRAKASRNREIDPVNERSPTQPKRPLSTRSLIDPFIVMDVMREANTRQATGEDIIHMEVGQPATPAPRAARERAQGA